MTYGCKNRAPFAKTVPLKSHYNISVEGHHVVCDAVELIPFVFTKTCVYTTSELGKHDIGCVGCNWKQESKRLMQEMDAKNSARIES